METKMIPTSGNLITWSRGHRSTSGTLALLADLPSMVGDVFAAGEVASIVAVPFPQALAITFKHDDKQLVGGNGCDCGCWLRSRSPVSWSHSHVNAGRPQSHCAHGRHIAVGLDGLPNNVWKRLRYERGRTRVSPLRAVWGYRCSWPVLWGDTSLP